LLYFLNSQIFSIPPRQVQVQIQLEVVRANGISTMDMVKSLVDMVSTLVSEVQQLKTDNHALKAQLRDLQQVPSMRCEATSSATSASASTAMKKSYRDIVCAVGGCPGSTVGCSSIYESST
jgi:cell shape-determining protein MreC